MTRRLGDEDTPKRVRPWRTGLEKPGSVLRGPPITVRCNCGERRELAYGDEWTCGRCGAEWDTRQIPREDYEKIRRIQLKFRVLPVTLGLLTATAALFFILTHNAYSLVLLLPAALITWTVLFRPAHRRRYRAAIADVPTWHLRPVRTPGRTSDA